MAKQNNDKAYLFEQAPIPKAVMSLCLPTILTSLVMVVYSLADTYFVGMLNDPIQSAAVSVASPALLAFNAINNLFGVGTSSAMSRALGRGDQDAVKRSSVFGVYCALTCSVLFALLTGCFRTPLATLLGADTATLAASEGYMLWAVTFNAVPGIMNVVFAYLVRSEGAALHASIGTMSGCILNIILDPIFIMPWGFGMGAAGAGLATFLSNTVACCYFLILIFVRRGKTLVSVNPKLFRFNKRIASDIFGVGIPASIQNLLNVTSMTIFNNFAAAYGADVMAAMGIAHKIQMVPMQISMGASQGIMPFVGYNYASENRERMKNSILYVAVRMVAFVIVMAGVCIAFGRNLMGLFIQTESVIAYGAAFLVGFMLAMPFQFIDFLGVGVYQAIGDGKTALLFAFLRKIVLEIPALIVLNKLVPLYGLAYATLFAEAVLATAAFFMLRNIFNGKRKPGQ